MDRADGMAPDEETAELSVWNIVGFTIQEIRDLVRELGTLVNGLAPNAKTINLQSGKAWTGKLICKPDLDKNSPTWGQDLSGNGHHYTAVGVLTAGTSYPPVASFVEESNTPPSTSTGSMTQWADGEEIEEDDMRGYRTRTAIQRLLVGDATRTLVPAPGVGKSIVVKKINYQVITPAAQPIDVGVSGGGVTAQLLSVAASGAGSGGANFGSGYALPENTALTAVPGAAGPVVQFQVEYYVTG